MDQKCTLIFSDLHVGTAKTSGYSTGTAQITKDLGSIWTEGYFSGKMCDRLIQQELVRKNGQDWCMGYWNTVLWEGKRYLDKHCS